MRSLKPILLLLLLILCPLQAYAEIQGFARLVLIEGDVQIREADTDDWVPAAVNTPLYEGDSIWTPLKSRTELQLQDGTIIRLDSKSSLNILKVDEESLQFHLGMGRIYLRTGEMKQWSMQLDMEDSTVKIYDKARLRMDITDKGEEEVSVYKGSAYVESYGNKTRVRKGEMLSVEDTKSEISPINPPDTWDKWNTKRDGKMARRTASSGNLPEELAVYDEELSSSGEWVEVQEYGRVWRPTVAVGPDWAPYQSGRWVWRGEDYVWVSLEPWGWAPYHYGRWSIVTGFGWCWVPPIRGDVFWAPGFVGWVTTPTYVGWVPLAPGETYYGHGRGHYGRHSVNVTNVTNITNVTINNTTNTYRNAGQRHAITTVDRDSFISGKGRYTPRSHDSFKKDKFVAGRPDPKPHAKEVRMPQVRKIPSSRLPPPSIAKQPVRELKERFPKIERGGESAPQRNRNRQAEGAREKQRQGESVTAPGTPSHKAPEGKAPLVKPAAQRPEELKRPSQGPPVMEPKRPETERRQRPAVETPGRQEPPATRGGESKPPEAKPAIPSPTRPPEARDERPGKQESTRARGVETRPIDVKPAPSAPVSPPPARAERRAPTPERRDQGVARPDQVRKTPERGQERKDAVRSSAPQPERKAKKVWKIQPKEDVPPAAKEKKSP